MVSPHRIREYPRSSPAAAENQPGRHPAGSRASGNHESHCTRCPGWFSVRRWIRPRTITIHCAGTAVGRGRHRSGQAPNHRRPRRTAGPGSGRAAGPGTAPAERFGVGDAGHVALERRDLSVYDAVFMTPALDPRRDD